MMKVGRYAIELAKKGPKKEPIAAPEPTSTSNMPLFPCGMSSIESESISIKYKEYAKPIAINIIVVKIVGKKEKYATPTSRNISKLRASTDRRICVLTSMDLACLPIKK
jgi:hypothetical protein